MRILISIILVMAIALPFAGQIALIKKNRNNAMVPLILVNVASIIMSVSYAVFFMSNDAATDVMVGYKVRTIGTSMFIVCNIMFTYAYLRVDRMRILTQIFLLLEVVYSSIVAFNDPWGLIIKSQEVVYNDRLGVYSLMNTYGPLHTVKYVVLCLLVIVTGIITIYRYKMATTQKERSNFARLAASEIMILLSGIARIPAIAAFDASTFITALGVGIIDFGVLKGDFIRVTDMGREWVFNNIDHSFVIVDSTYRFLDCNAEAIRTFPTLSDYRVGRMIPKELLQVFSCTDETISYNDRLYTKMVMDMTDNGSVTGHTMILDDVTYKYQLINNLREEKNRADEANLAKSQFVSTISHEIRTPMNAIVGITDILRRKDCDKETREYLNNIKSSGDALLMIINDILDYSKIEAGQMNIIEDEYSPKKLINDMHMMFVTRIGSKPVELCYDICEDLPGRLVGDIVRIRQIIINFMNNAIKFTDEGKVTLTVRVASETDTTVMMEFLVSDTGQGIKKEDLDKIFLSFSQVDEQKNHSKEGTGLGLAICKQLAELMGGSITVTSEYGVGSCFSLRLPQTVVIRGKADDIEEDTTEQFYFTTPNTKLLLVDDNEMNLKVAKGLLEPLDIQIDIAVNGMEAYKKIQNTKYDIVFMDHMMPVMDGVETTRKIRALADPYYKKLPIIALSANVTSEAREQFDNCGMDGFIGKPIRMNQVFEALIKNLPQEQIVKVDKDPSGISESTKDVEAFGSIEGLDVKAGIENCGKAELYYSLLGDYYKLMDIKAGKITKCLDDHMIKDYTVEVHALKNTSRMIGAVELSEEFKKLEELGDAGDVEELKKLTPDVLKHMYSYKSVLEPYAIADNMGKEKVSKEEIEATLEEIYTAMDTFEIDRADKAKEKLLGYQLPESIMMMALKLDALVSDVAIEDAMELIGKIQEELGNIE